MARRGRVVVEDNWRRHRVRRDHAFRTGIERGMQQAARAAASTTGRYRIGSIVATTRALPVRKTRRGWLGAIAVADWRGIFFEKGTAHGIKPVRFLRKGVQSVRHDIPGYIRDAYRL